MKKILFTISLLAILSCQSSQNTTNQNSATDRNVENSSVRTSTQTRTTGLDNPKGVRSAHGKEFIQHYLQETYTNLENEVKGLSSQQLQFKPNETSWSIMQCLEHIVDTEPKLLEMAKESMKKSATPERRSEIKITDDQMLQMITNRDFKAQAPTEMQPKGVYTSVNSALNQLQANRKIFVQELNQFSMEDLRNHMVDTPIGTSDVYQFMLIIPGHTARHTLQIKEVKNHPNFPKS